MCVWNISIATGFQKQNPEAEDESIFLLKRHVIVLSNDGKISYTLQWYFARIRH